MASKQAEARHIQETNVTFQVVREPCSQGPLGLKSQGEFGYGRQHILIPGAPQIPLPPDSSMTAACQTAQDGGLGNEVLPTGVQAVHPRCRTFGPSLIRRRARWPDLQMRAVLGTGLCWGLSHAPAAPGLHRPPLQVEAGQAHGAVLSLSFIGHTPRRGRLCAETHRRSSLQLRGRTRRAAGRSTPTP